ncbi:unnamed protein product [Protopolystoma xenopodis]|uniref:ATPase dynein-related AAA domain-containing protein n=1 Tax=Protopolystoma xenopodis TaxID=117903 RepID=A0A448XFV7_9PLAT|nr:unnamed protein product [Protopolystoma xenopodis]
MRDLFRWAERYRRANFDDELIFESQRSTSKFYPSNHSKNGTIGVTLFDWDAFLAEQGYLLLAGRVRRPEEARVVAEVIEKVFRRPIDEEKLFDLTDHTSPSTRHLLEMVMDSSSLAKEQDSSNLDSVVWTRDARRLFVLIGTAIKYSEPVLIVGETGCGKTTMCQFFAALQKKRLFSVNCHQYSEAADFIGGLRPVRHVRDQSSKVVYSKDVKFNI